MYGEDGLDVLKTQMLKDDKSLYLLAQNYNAAVNEEHVETLRNRVEVDLEKLKKQVYKILLLLTSVHSMIFISYSFIAPLKNIGLFFTDYLC